MLHGISQTAVTPGSEVTLFGEGFTQDAVVLVGDAEVPAADVLAVDANSLRFRTSAALPELGRVRVKAAGATTASDRIHLARTPMWAPTIGPLNKTELIRGANKLSIPGINAAKDAALLLPGEPADATAPVQLKLTAGSLPTDVTVQIPNTWPSGPAWLQVVKGHLGRTTRVVIK